MSDSERVVYSTDHGRMCPECGKAAKKCRCKQEQAAPAGDGIVRISRERKGRGGKTVTVVSGIPKRHDEIKDIGKKLKARCGTGGTTKNGVIEIQGDHRDLIKVELEKFGFTVKFSGG